jgi:type I restriction enzyme S subunit
MNKDKLIPELRFPEFREPWHIITVSEVCDVYRGGTFSKADMDENGLNPCIHYGELFTKYNEVISTIYSKTNKIDGFKSYSGDILMPSSDVTPDGLANVVLGGDMNILRPQTSTNSIFLCYLLNHSKKEIIKLVSGTTVKHIYPSQIITCKIPTVNNELEQKKIASCLSSLDEVITAHNQKLDLLKDHKKGLMQNLFPQEGEKVPKYRFKEFEKDGEWLEKKLGELGYFLGGGTPSRSNDDYWIGNIPWISSSDIKEDDIHNISLSQYINENAIIESATKKIPKGSILFVSRVGVGKLAINTEELCTSQDFTSFIPAEVLNLFVAYYYSANKNALESLSQGTSIKGFSKSDLEDSKILYPRNPKEQQKIASCLSSLDALITAQAEKIEHLKLHKKGLMQGLFPKIND